MRHQYCIVKSVTGAEIGGKKKKKKWSTIWKWIGTQKEVVFLEPFSAINNLKHDTWPFLWMLNVVEKADDLFSARVNNVKREPGVFALLWSVLSHLIQQVHAHFFFTQGCVELLSPRSRQLPLICNTSARGRRSPASFNQSVRTNRQSKQTTWGELGFHSAHLLHGVGIERQMIRRKTGQECYRYIIKNWGEKG